MGRFDKNRNFGKRDFGDRNEERAMYPATCSNCGNRCEVPFRPAPGKSVLCRDCFRKEGDFGPRKPEGKNFGKPFRNSFGKPSFDDRKMFEATCAECGNRCEVPFRPNGEKPVYCENCFSRSKGEGFTPKKMAPSQGSQGQWDQLNTKLDRILKALESIALKKEPMKMEEKPLAKPVKDAIKEAPKKEAKEEKAKRPAKAKKPEKKKKSK